MTENEARIAIEKTCDIITIASASHENVVRAIRNNDFKDFEDCLQDECARAVDAKYIVTCNAKDFSKSSTQAILPDDFLKLPIWDNNVDVGVGD